MPNYPDSKDLEKIKGWDVATDPFGLIDFITPLLEEMGTIRVTGKRVKKVYIATGGWSGNEEIISALRESKYLFWQLYWEKSERGGAFTFKVYKLK